MAVSFPQNPTVGDTFEAADLLYTWDGTRWISTFTPGLDYKGPKGNTGATGPVGPASNAVTVVESADEDLNFALLFAEQNVPTGVTTIFRDTGGLAYDPGSNTLRTEAIECQVIAPKTLIGEQYLQTFDDNGTFYGGRIIDGISGSRTISTELTTNALYAIDVVDAAQTELNIFISCIATGNIVQQKYTLWRTAAADGFTVTNWQNLAIAPNVPIDATEVDNGVIADPLLGIYFQRSSTNNTVFTLGTFTRLAGTYDITFRIEASRYNIPNIVLS